MLAHLERQITVNRRRERETYSKMFTPAAASASEPEQGGSLSVQDYVDKKQAAKRS